MPVSVDIPLEKYRGAVREVTLGAGSDAGGTRARTVTVGGERTLPFLKFEGEMPNRPVVGVEIAEQAPTGWSELLARAWSDVWDDPAAWAAKAEQLGADLIVMRCRTTATAR